MLVTFLVAEVEIITSTFCFRPSLSLISPHNINPTMAPKVTIYALGGPGGGPNPKKCYIYLNKLGVEYNAVPLEFSADEKKGVKGAE